MAKIVKKKHPKFNVPNYGAKSRSRVKPRWRKQRGADNKKRIKKAFAGGEPTVGYKNPDSVIGMRANGKRIVVVHNMAELRSAMTSNSSNAIDITLSSSMGRKKRIELTSSAISQGFNVTNGAFK
ncbi:MAG: eL32 family ribosomal protein [Candidatus Micrarchaeaceae archaeon]